MRMRFQEGRPFTPDDLEPLCAAVLSPVRKETGAFYTPARAAVRIVESALDAMPDLTAEAVPGLRIIDPACGCGAFLTAVLRVLHRRYGVLPRPENICGIELHPAAAEISALRLRWLYLRLSGQTGRPGIVSGDALTANQQFRPGSFDLVIGNPPFVPICEIPPARRRDLKKRFRFANGRFNFFSLFLELGANLAKPDGTCAWLVPDRLLLNTDGAALRRWLLTEHTLLSVSSLPAGLFGDAVVQSASVIFRRSPRPPNHRFTVVSSSGFVEHRPAAQALTMPCCRIIPTAAADDGFLHRVRESSIRLGDIADVRDGVIQGAVGDVLFLRSPSGAANPKPLLTGRDVQRGKILPHSLWIDYDPTRMKALEASRLKERPRGLRLRSPEVMERPKILTRQTADGIIAACDPAGRFYYANTLHGTSLKTRAYSLRFLAAVMNSRIVDRWYRGVVCETGKPFAQVKIAVLKELPVCRASRTRQLEVVRAVRAGDSETVERLIAALYGL